ncbi:MAG: hypothetical protein HYV63_01995 [Candidatus Schekmanbacteria bacterium]|nr:hypothetical protein [Candidatus Schekmanbacteria bacterium]
MTPNRRMEIPVLLTELQPVAGIAASADELSSPVTATALPPPPISSTNADSDPR